MVAVYSENNARELFYRKLTYIAGLQKNPFKHSELRYANYTFVDSF